MGNDLRYQMKHIVSTFSVVCVIVLAIWGCENKSEKIENYKITITAHSAVTPVPQSPQSWNAFWMPRHQSIIDRVKQGNVDLIFIGDSITHFWDRPNQGKEIWETYYAKRNALNMGFAGDQTQNVLWRLENGEIAGISPKLVILMIGTNNSGPNAAYEIGEGIIAICKTLRKNLPHTKILLLAIFPRDEKPSERREKNAQASKLASTIADNKWIYYMDIGDKFLNKDGTISKEIMFDYLHLTAKGYQAEAKAIEPMVKKLMNE